MIGRPPRSTQSRSSAASDVYKRQVVGATIGDAVEDLAINGPLLVPGLGAQGGTPQDLRRLFASVYDFIIPSTSRALLGEGPEVAALRGSVARVNSELVGS